MLLSVFLLPFLSLLVIIFAEITSLLMEVMDMMLNMMIIGLMVLMIVGGAAYIKAEEIIKNEKERKTTGDIWDWP